MSALELKEMVQTLISDFEKNIIGKDGYEAYKLAHAFDNDIGLMCRRRFWEGDPQYNSIMWDTDAMRDEIYNELEDLLSKNSIPIQMINAKTNIKLQNIAKDYKELTGKDTTDNRYSLGGLLHHKYEFPLSQEISKQYKELKDEFIQELLHLYLEVFKTIKTWFQEKDKITVESLVENFKVQIEDYENEMEKDEDADEDTGELHWRTIVFTQDIEAMIDEEDKKKPWDNEVFASRDELLKKARNGIFVSFDKVQKALDEKLEGNEDFLVKLKAALGL